MTTLVRLFLGLSFVLLCHQPSWCDEAPALQKINGRDVFRHSFDHEVIVITLPPGEWTVTGGDIPKGNAHGNMYAAGFLPQSEKNKDLPNRGISMISHLGLEDSPKDILSGVQKGSGSVNVIEDKNPDDIFFERNEPATEGFRQSYTLERVIKGRDGLHLILAEQKGIPITPVERDAMIQIIRSVKLENKDVPSVVLAAPTSEEIKGAWQSEFGTLNITSMTPNPPPGSATITGGYWDQEGAGRGEIKAGHYNGKNGHLTLDYYQPWNDQSGAANFDIDDSGKTFTGTWKNDDGRSGVWTLRR